ncbi:MAG: 6-carboxytetrahydropterin synthase QueD [Deltaproteobacteria bacterium]|nr:MAG: 6-carboxytetrahydropterin synthase QueD [Deltaproteobacteria bacterium]
MRCELVCDYKFEAAHRLPKVPPDHKCARMHGHSYEVQVTVAGEVDPEFGWLVDFAEIDAVVRPLIAQLDHRVLNDIDGLDNPTCEHLTRWIYDRIRARLPMVAAVAVAETRSSRCVYRGQ